jgi:hypothetical protein
MTTIKYFLLFYISIAIYNVYWWRATNGFNEEARAGDFSLTEFVKRGKYVTSFIGLDWSYVKTVPTFRHTLKSLSSGWKDVRIILRLTVLVLNPSRDSWTDIITGISTWRVYSNETAAVFLVGGGRRKCTDVRTELSVGVKFWCDVWSYRMRKNYSIKKKFWGDKYIKLKVIKFVQKEM